MFESASESAKVSIRTLRVLPVERELKQSFQSASHENFYSPNFTFSALVCFLFASSQLSECFP